MLHSRLCGNGARYLYPEVSDRRPKKDTVPVRGGVLPVNMKITFGVMPLMMEMFTNTSAENKGAANRSITLQIIPCGYRFSVLRFCLLWFCENDSPQLVDEKVQLTVFDADAKLKQAKRYQKRTHDPR